jgi:hypothetical protein
MLGASCGHASSMIYLRVPSRPLCPLGIRG